MDGWIDDAQMDGWVDLNINQWMDGFEYKIKDGWMIDRWMD